MKLRLVDASVRRVAHVAIVLGEDGAGALRAAESREGPVATLKYGRSSNATPLSGYLPACIESLGTARCFPRVSDSMRYRVRRYRAVCISRLETAHAKAPAPALATGP